MSLIVKYDMKFTDSEKMNVRSAANMKLRV